MEDSDNDANSPNKMEKKLHKKGKNKQDKNNKNKQKMDKQKPVKRKNQMMREEIEKIKELKTELPGMIADDVESFAKLPLSAKTLKGLKNCGFTVPTKVQRQSLIYSLGGLDVVAAAKTGSGKTLAFIIPILEQLYCNVWTHMDGLGAIVITPTRELAYQIFDVLNKVGKEHDFSAGLVIGGTDLTYEWKRVSTCNIMICTPGRLLQHMTENPDFIVENVQMIVLDEADMCLSMGFAETMNCILEELPTKRQTLLFSATQTRDVKDLIRAGCNNPVFCSVHEHSKTSTPKTLVESYVVCEPHEKFTFLWSFITYHKKQKILVFLSTCKQVSYVNNMFCKLQPGLVVMALHGKMKQLKRMAIYDQFCRKKSGVLFCTDVAARGLDFPEIHWVVQADCPEDVNTYIHRAGRTARYSMGGEALLLLTSSEEPVMVNKLKAKNIPVEKISIDDQKQRNISVKMDIILTKYTNLKEEAIRAFKSYVKHIAQLKDKKVFNVLSIDLDAYARSLGLIVTPRVRFLERLLKQKYGDSKIRETPNPTEKPRPSTLDFGADDSDEDDDDGFLVSSKIQPVPTDENIDPDMALSKKKKKFKTKEDVANKLMRKNIKVNQVLVFDDDGNIVQDPSKVRLSEVGQSNDQPSQGINIEELKQIIKKEDTFDRKLHQERHKIKKKIKKLKEKELRKQEIEAKKAEDKEEEEDGDESDEDSDVDDFTQNIIDSLPDPDKIYGKSKNDDESSGSESEMTDTQNSGEEDDSESGDSASDDETEQKSPKTKMSGKRKAKLKFREAKRAKMAQSNNLSDLPVDEQEQLALFLLSGRK